MKRYPLLLAMIFMGLLGMVNVAYAPWSTLGTGYAITSNVHGVDVIPGTLVTVTAGSLDPNVVQVTFRWHMPNETVTREVTVPVFTNGTTGQWNDGSTALVRFAVDSFRATVLGDWGVQAFFQGSLGSERAELEHVVRIRATSLNVIPEVPFGTLTILVGMFGALGFFALKGKSTLLNKRPT